MKPVRSNTGAVGRSSAGGSRPDTWDRAAASYDEERAGDPMYHVAIDRVRRAIDRVHPKRVLDMGCGTGLTTQPLCRPSRLVVASDYSHVSLRTLQRKRCAARLLQADLCALPYRDGSFDAVLCANTLQHLPPVRHAQAIRELCRVLAPRGLLVLTVHHYSRAKRRAGWIKEGKPGQAGIDYIFRFAYDELRTLLPRAEILAIGMAPRIERFLPRIAMRYAARFGGGHMLLAVQRGRH